MAERIPLSEQIKEVKREIALRNSAYPKFVSGGRMTQDAADKHLAIMRAALATLEWMARTEEKIKASFAVPLGAE